MKILALDPSGSFKEGKGTTGFCKFINGTIENVYDLKAKGFETRVDYWKEHIEIIQHEKPEVVVCEDFVLYGHKAKQQTGSQMETSQLIGYIEMKCVELGIPFVKQRATIKIRFSDDILVLKGYIQKGQNRYLWNGQSVNLHIRDSIRHAVYFWKYGREKLNESLLLSN